MTRTASSATSRAHRPARSTLRSTDVLRVLDEAARNEVFPSIDGRGHPVDQRLHVYRGDADRWAIVVETLRYSGPGENVYDVLHVIGNCVEGEQGAIDPVLDLLPRIENWEEVVETSFPARLREGTRVVVVRGQYLPVSAVPGERMLETLRRIAPGYRSLLLGSDEELKARLPEDLVEVLTLDEWHHPDICRGEMPGANETFRQIASVIATGSSVCYRPTRIANTHWSRWTRSEVAELPSAFTAPERTSPVVAPPAQRTPDPAVAAQPAPAVALADLFPDANAVPVLAPEATTPTFAVPGEVQAVLDPYPAEGRAGVGRVRVRPRVEWMASSPR